MAPSIDEVEANLKEKIDEIYAFLAESGVSEKRSVGSSAASLATLAVVSTTYNLPPACLSPCPAPSRAPHPSPTI
jgi:hypothetical protein